MHIILGHDIKAAWKVWGSKPLRNAGPVYHCPPFLYPRGGIHQRRLRNLVYLCWHLFRL